MKRFLLLWLLVITAILSSCEKKDEPNPQLNPKKNYIPPKTHIYKEEQSSPIEKVLDNGVVVYNQDTPKDKIPKVGEIICSGVTKAAPYGFLYRVEKVENKDGKIEVKTSPAQIQEIVKNYKGRIPLNLNNSSIMSIKDADGNPVKFSQLRTLTSSNAISFEIVKTVEDKDFSSDIKIKLSLESEFIVDIEWFEIQEFGLEIKAAFDTEVDAKFELKGKLEKEFELYTIRLTPVTVLVGVVPVVFTPEIKAILKFGLDGKISLSTKVFHIKREVSMGYRYTSKADPETGKKHNYYSDSDSKGGLFSIDKFFESITNAMSKINAGVDFGGKVTVSIDPNFSLYDLNSEAHIGFGMDAIFKTGIKLKLALANPNGVYFSDEAYSNVEIEGKVTANLNIPLFDDIKGELKINILNTPLVPIVGLTPQFDKLRTSEGADGVSIFAIMKQPAFIINVGDWGFMYCKDNPYHEQINKENIKLVSLANKYPDYSNIKFGWTPSLLLNPLSIEGFIPIDQLEVGATYYVYPYSEFLGIRLPHKSVKFTVKSKGGGRTPVIIGDDLF